MIIRVRTETGSIHELDMLAMTYVRLKKGERSGELRRDGEVMPMISFFIGDEGEPLQVWLRLREDGVSTLRTTSAIVQVENLREEP